MAELSPLYKAFSNLCSSAHLLVSIPNDRFMPLLMGAAAESGSQGGHPILLLSREKVRENKTF
jgi:hypothetical protein